MTVSAAPLFRQPGAPPEVEVTVVAAVYDEGQGVDELVDRTAAALAACGLSHEIVVVDDGSADDTLAKLTAAAERHPALRVAELARNYGQVAAVGAGMSIARGRWIVMMDGDLQHDPAQIPALLGHTKLGHDLVATYRERREEPLKRRAVTWVANRVNRFLTGLPVKDFGSSFRVIDARIVDSLRDRDGVVHYNTPALYAAARNIVQVPTVQRKRPHGSTKWTFAMFVAYNLDFLTASQRVTHALLAVSAVTFAAGAVLYALKLLGVAGHVESASAPAVILVSALQLATMAIVWREMLRTQRLAKGVPSFVLRRVITGGGAA